MKYGRHDADEEDRIILAVRDSQLSAAKALKCLGIPRSTYYGWLKKRSNPDAHSGTKRRAWNSLLPDEIEAVVQNALEMSSLSPRNLSFTITDTGLFSVSESSVYRILKTKGLVKPATVIAAKAGKEYKRKTGRVNEMWATDFMHVKVMGWGWYYAGGLLDDNSRYLICFDLQKDMEGGTCSDLLQLGLERTGLVRLPVEDRNLKLLSDNGSGYLSDQFNTYLNEQGVNHIFISPHHPQSNGKMERLNETARGFLMQTVYCTPEELKFMLEDFRYWYNYVHCHESLGNLRPADIYNGRGDAILKARSHLKAETVNRRREFNAIQEPGATFEI